MASQSASAGGRPRTFRRDPDAGIVAGVCAGIATELGLDVTLVRVVFVALALAGGIGAAVYALLWALVPPRGAPARLAPRRLGGRGSVEVAFGVAFLLLSLLLTLRALGIWWSDTLVWPVVLIGGGAALLWRAASAAGTASPAGEAEPPEAPAVVASRAGVGVALVVAAGVAFLGATGALSAARDVVLSVLVVAIVLAVIFGPWIVRMARSLATERAERIRSQERAEMAAHLHDSVLQTLALVQQRADDPSEVSALARRQERELRAWLSGRTAARDERKLVTALEEAAGAVERERGVEVDVVAVGDRVLDERGEALVAAAREAMLNAAKFGHGSTVDV